MIKKPSSVPYVVLYRDKSSEVHCRELIQTALKNIAALQGIACVCIDRITLPDDILEANTQLDAYTIADLVWFHFSENSIMTEKVFVKSIRPILKYAPMGSPVWGGFLDEEYRHFYKSPWEC